YEKNGIRCRATIQNLFDTDYIVGSRGIPLFLSQGRKRYLSVTIGWDFEGGNLFHPVATP
ncbi:MAG: hypothetical protein AAGC68_15030, partial [Verrucomicrobiota bacterium]